MNYLTASHSTTTTTLDTVSAAGDAYLPPLSQGESIVWSRNQTKGVFHKHVICREWITNY